MTSKPDFYLTSSEHEGDLRRVRRCWSLRRVNGPLHQQYLWIRVDPPIIGHVVGHASDVTEVLLSPHYEGDHLFPPSDFPIRVYIYVPHHEDVVRSERVESKDVDLAAWGEVYRSEAEAAAVAETR
jgi:hypothetical protein